MPNNRLTISPDRHLGTSSLPFSRACLLAIAIETLLLLGAATMLAHAMSPPAPASEPPMELVFAETPPPPKEEPKPKPMPKPVTHPAPAKPLQVPAAPAPLPLVPDSPIALPAPPPPPPAPQQADKAAEKEAEFAARVKAAIQAAVVYPAAARNMGYRGKARVEFIFHDGAVQQIRIIQSSGVGMIDNAALTAVANARYPAVPESLKGKDVPYQVYVLFELNASN